MKYEKLIQNLIQNLKLSKKSSDSMSNYNFYNMKNWIPLQNMWYRYIIKANQPIKEKYETFHQDSFENYY